MAKLWVVWILCIFVASPTWAMGSKGGDASAPASGETTLQLLAAAEAAGEIDADTAVEYRVYAVKDDAKLPDRYRGDRPMKDGTGVLRQARGRFPDLRPEVQERLRPYLYPEGRP